MPRLAPERKLYDQLRVDLEAKSMGKWVLIHGSELIGVFATFEAAAEEAARRFGRGPCLIRQIGTPEVTLQFDWLPWWLWSIPVAVLLAATQKMPHGYYTFTRIAVCGFAVIFARIAWKGGFVSRLWSVIFASAAILFNPIIEIHLGPAVWRPIDVAVAVAFAAHLFFVRSGFSSAERS